MTVEEYVDIIVGRLDMFANEWKDGSLRYNWPVDLKENEWEEQEEAFRDLLHEEN